MADIDKINYSGPVTALAYSTDGNYLLAGKSQMTDRETVTMNLNALNTKQ